MVADKNVKGGNKHSQGKPGELLPMELSVARTTRNSNCFNACVTLVAIQYRASKVYNWGTKSGRGLLSYVPFQRS